jgi:hypothetical protein
MGIFQVGLQIFGIISTFGFNFSLTFKKSLRKGKYAEKLSYHPQPAAGSHGKHT